LSPGRERIFWFAIVEIVLKVAITQVTADRFKIAPHAQTVKAGLLLELEHPGFLDLEIPRVYSTATTSEEATMIGGIGVTELIIILVIVLVIFGANKLPEIGAGMGKAIKNFKKATVEPEEIDVTPERKKEVEQEKDK
jgi:sec-independent protein translocase protein TatA